MNPISIILFLAFMLALAGFINLKFTDAVSNLPLPAWPFDDKRITIRFSGWMQLIASLVLFLVWLFQH